MDDNDGNIIAYIYPALGTMGQSRARRAISQNIEHPGYTPPRHCRLQDKEAPCFKISDIVNVHDEETLDEENQENLEHEACIKLTFNHIPKTRSGLRCGYGEDAELRVSSARSIGLYHFALTFDDSYHLIVRDLGSTSGTTVVYGRAERGPWSDFSWIVGGSDFLKGISSVIVKVSTLLQFRLVIPHHNIQSKLYRDKVDRYRAGSADVEQIFRLGNVGLSSHVRTALPSGIHTPAIKPTKPVTLQRKVGEGSFASVYRVWIVSTGEQDAWEREALIMLQIKHKHIVSLIGFSSPPKPWLHLEYMPHGTLSDRLKDNNDFSRLECGQILIQALDGLTYLHASDPQIVHRDIKPNNILISHRRNNDIFIKLADFGLAHEGDTLMTMCGTYVYIAPEIYIANATHRSQREAYTALVDVWSLGVVLVELLYGLPKHGRKNSMGVDWCETICEWAEMKSRAENDEMLSFLLDSMLRLRPSDRKTAADCYKGALPLIAQAQERRRDVDDGCCSIRPEDGEATIILGNIKRLGDQTIGIQNVDSGIGDSSLCRYLVSNPGRQASSSNIQPPRAKAAMVHVGQILSKFRNLEDSLFYESTFGEVINGSYDEDFETASTIVPAHHTKPQEGVEAGLIESVSGHAAPVGESLSENMEWSKLGDDTETTIEQTKTLTCNETQASMSLKRSSAAM
ncbi:checkpoint kinase [Trichoderma evansii]